MFDLSPEKLLLLGVIAMIVLGPERLPHFARKAGQVIAEVRKASGSFQSEVRDALAEPRKALDEAVGEIGLGSIPKLPTVPNLRRTVIDTLSAPAPTAPVSPAPVSPGPTSPGLAYPLQAPADATAAAAPDDPSLN